MESFIFSHKQLKSISQVETEIKNRSTHLILLDLKNNMLIDLDISLKFNVLKTLILDINKIKSITNFPQIKTLENLSISGNLLTDPIQFAGNCIEKFEKIKSINTLSNPMNPGFENYDTYLRFRSIMKKIKTLIMLDCENIDDDTILDFYKNTKESKPTLGYNEEITAEVMNEDKEKVPISCDINLRKRPCSITFSQKMLKKADKLTKFDRKNHSEGNKHITNDHL